MEAPSQHFSTRRGFKLFDKFYIIRSCTLKRAPHQWLQSYRLKPFCTVYSKRNKPLLKREVHNETFSILLTLDYQIYYYGLVF